MDTKAKRELSAEIFARVKDRPRFSNPTELIDAMKKAKKETGLYPVFTKSRSADSFVRFLNGRELADFKAFGKPRWKPHGGRKYGFKDFTIEISDVYAGGLYPENTPYEVSGYWRKKGLFDGKGSNVRYDVSLFIDGGWHIDQQTICAKKPLPLKKVLAEAVERSAAEKGKRFDGYWY